MSYFGEFVNSDKVPLLALPEAHTRLMDPLIYEYTAANPAMAYIDRSGKYWRPDNHFYTDLGSVPLLLQGIPGLQKDRWIRSYIMHDSCYKHGYLWCMGEKKELSKGQIDTMLFDMVRAEGGGAFIAWTIYLGVRAGTPLVRYPVDELQYRRVVRMTRNRLYWPNNSVS